MSANSNDDDQQQQQQLQKSVPVVTNPENIDINQFADDEEEAPLMSHDETVQEFLEYARYNDEGAEQRLKEMATANPKLLSEYDISSGRTALHMAASNNYLHIIHALSKCPGFNPNIKASKTLATPIHDAVIANQPEAVALLLTLGGDPIATNDTNETAIELSEKLGREEISTLLLKADKTIDTFQTEHGKITMDIDESEINDGNSAGKSSAVNNKGSAASAAVTAGSTTEQQNPDVDDVE